MRTVKEIIQAETTIIEQAETVLKTDKHYQDASYGTAKLAYRYGRITMSLAIQIVQLKKEIETLKKR